MHRSIGILVAVMAFLGFACAQPAPELPPEPAPDPSHFSGERAWQHLERLVESGPRVPGTPGAEKARGYIRAELEALGLNPNPREFSAEQELSDGGIATVRYENLVGVIDGEVEDIVILAAPYDSRHFASFPHLGANNGASGAALLLELARVLTVDPIPYTVWVAFLDGEAPHAEEADPEAGLLGSRALVHDLTQMEKLSQLRLVVYFNQVADRDLAIARDLRSDRVLRQTFQRVARELGHESLFSEQRPFSRPAGGHSVFLSAGFRRVIAVIDDRYGGDEAPGVYWQTEEDTLERCDPESLEIVGTVSNAGLRDVVALLRKVDRFTRQPIPDSPATADDLSPPVAPSEEEGATSP